MSHGFEKSNDFSVGECLVKIAWREDEIQLENMESHTDLLCPTTFAMSYVKVGIARRESLVRLEIL